MEEEADDDAARGRISTIDADDEDKVQTEKGETEIDQDLQRLLRSEFPNRSKHIQRINSYS